MARLRFQAQDSIIKVLRKGYCDGLVKKVQKCDKFNFKYRQALLGLEFLSTVMQKRKTHSKIPTVQSS